MRMSQLTGRKTGEREANSHPTTNMFDEQFNIKASLCDALTAAGLFERLELAPVLFGIARTTNQTLFQRTGLA